MHTLTMTTNERRATAEALKVATRVKDRPILQGLLVRDGRAFVTDSYVMVALPWLDGLDDGSYDAGPLVDACKGAGSDVVRLEQGDGRITATRVDPGHVAPAMLDELTTEQLTERGMVRGTFVAHRMDGTPPDAPKLFDDAVARIEADDYAPELAHLDADRLTLVSKAHPSYFDRTTEGKAVQLAPCGLKPAVVSNGAPYALVMPVRVG